MKADRRHELKENDLVHILEQGKSYLDQNGKRLGLIVAGVLALVVLIGVALRSRAAGIEDTWRRHAELKFDKPEELMTALNSLKELGASASDSAFLLNSLVERGTQALRGARQFPGAVPNKDLNEHAREAFQQLLDRFSSNPLAVGLAHSGLATVEENAFVLDGQASHKDVAKRHLDAIVTNTTLFTTPYNRIAVDRLKSLDLTFQAVKFAPPAPVAATAAPVTPTPVTPPTIPAEVPAEIREKILANPPAESNNPPMVTIKPVDNAEKPKENTPPRAEGEKKPE